MNNILYLIKKDFLMIKNLKSVKKLELLLPVVIIATFAYNGGGALDFYHLHWMFNDMILFTIIFISLLFHGGFSISNDLQDGVMSQLFLIRNLKNYELYIAKLIYNFIVVLFNFIVLELLINPIALTLGYPGLFLNYTPLTLVFIILIVLLITSLSYFCAIFMKSERSSTVTYVLLFLFGISYKLFELINITGQIQIYIGFSLLNILLIWLTCNLLKKGSLYNYQ